MLMLDLDSLPRPCSPPRRGRLWLFMFKYAMDLALALAVVAVHGAWCRVIVVVADGKHSNTTP
jgi:hypothetical protein